jgi:hypothetical protein
LIAALTTAKAFPSGAQVISPSVLNDHDWTGELVLNKADLYAALRRYVGSHPMANKKKPAKRSKASADRALNLGNVVAVLPYILIALQRAQEIVAATGDAQIGVAIDAFAAAGIQAIEAGIGKDVVNDPLVLDATRQVHEAFVSLKTAIADAKARNSSTGRLA